MVKLLKTLLAYNLKYPKHQNNKGFTLIEILVGLILAFLVILPLLGFMVNMMQTDRQEQAKASSEQEIQSALSYINRDLEQSVYIYDSYGLDKIKTSLPTQTNSTPVLVFWKRQFLKDVIPKDDGKDDAFVYALVAYYLKTPPQPGCAQDTFSCTAQVTRVQYVEAVKNGKNQDGSDIIVKQGDPPSFKNFGQSLKDEKLNYPYIEDIMNAWTNTDLTAKTPEVLIDYIDQTPLPDGTVVCPPIQRTQAPTKPTPIPVADYSNANWQQVPHPTFNTISPIKTYGFYACVDSEKTTAQVVMRGNALARMRKKNSPPTYVKQQAAYFPKASIQVRGRGLYSPNVTDN